MKFFVTWVIELWGQGNKKHVQQHHRIYECSPEELVIKLKDFAENEGKALLNVMRNSSPVREVQTTLLYHQPIILLPE